MQSVLYAIAYDSDLSFGELLGEIKGNCCAEQVPASRFDKSAIAISRPVIGKPLLESPYGAAPLHHLARTAGGSSTTQFLKSMDRALEAPDDRVIWIMACLPKDFTEPLERQPIEVFSLFTARIHHNLPESRCISPARDCSLFFAAPGSVIGLGIVS